MRTAEILYRDTRAGILTETDEGRFIFQYDEKYVLAHPDQFLTFTMPVTKYPLGIYSTFVLCKPF